MKLLKLAAAIALFASTPALASNWRWRAFGDDMAGGTVSVTFAASPTGTASPGPYMAAIVGIQPSTGTATITVPTTPTPTTVVFTVTGRTDVATWMIVNSVPGTTIATVSIDLAPSTRLSVFDRTFGGAFGTRFGRRGRDYTWMDVAGDGFAADPVTGFVYSVPPSKDVGDLFFELDLTFAAGAFVTGNTLNFRADTDKPKRRMSADLDSYAVCLDSCLPTDDDYDECRVDPDLVGACFDAKFGDCVQATQDECQAAGFDYHGDGTPCAVNGQCIPALSEWGLMVMALLAVTAGTVIVMRRRTAVA